MLLFILIFPGPKNSSINFFALFSTVTDLAGQTTDVGCKLNEYSNTVDNEFSRTLMRVQVKLNGIKIFRRFVILFLRLANFTSLRNFLRAINRTFCTLLV